MRTRSVVYALAALLLLASSAMILVMTNKRIGLAIVAHAHRQPVVRFIATRHTDASTRAAAVVVLSDESALAQLARKDSDPGVRGVAVSRVKGQAVLADIAQTDEDASVRRSAAGSLTNVALLTNVAETDGDPSVRATAVKRLRDQAALARIARTDVAPSVRQTAVWRLKDKTVIANVAQHDNDAGVRTVAVDRLDDQAVLARVARTDSAPRVRWCAVTHLQDQTVLAERARGDSDPGVRAAAVSAWKHELLKFRPTRLDRVTAAEKALANISGTDVDGAVRAAAAGAMLLVYPETQLPQHRIRICWRVLNPGAAEYTYRFALNRAANRNACAAGAEREENLGSSTCKVIAEADLSSNIAIVALDRRTSGTICRRFGQASSR